MKKLFFLTVALGMLATAQAQTALGSGTSATPSGTGTGTGTSASDITTDSAMPTGTSPGARKSKTTQQRMEESRGNRTHSPVAPNSAPTTAPTLKTP